MPHKRKRGSYATWFAEIPVELKQQFQEIYPGRRSMKLFTVAFVTWAIRHRPDLEALSKRWVNEKKEERLDTGTTGKVPRNDGSKANETAAD